MCFFPYVTNTQAYQQKSEKLKNESLLGSTPDDFYLSPQISRDNSCRVENTVIPQKQTPQTCLFM